jgi:pSer/pThr/pTyr-binding forkhead associated (FHA) protein
MAATLVIFDKHGTRKDVDLNTGVTVVGRRPDCDVRIPTPLVSRKHCQIMQNDEGLTIQDLGSANGTMLNDNPVVESELHPGDTLKIGDVKFIVQIDGNPQSIAPPEDTMELSGSFLDMSGSHITQTPDLDDSLSDLDPTAG